MWKLLKLCLQCPSTQVDHAFSEYLVNPGQKRVICSSSSEKRLGSLSTCIQGLSSKVETSFLHFPGEPVLSGSLWQSLNMQLYFGTQPCILLKDCRGLIMTKKSAYSTVCFSSFPLKTPNSGCYKEPRMEYSKATSHSSFLSGSFLCCLQSPFPFHLSRQKRKFYNHWPLSRNTEEWSEANNRGKRTTKTQTQMKLLNDLTGQARQCGDFFSSFS